eukprot:1035732-Amphidinium_carterae.2
MVGCSDDHFLVIYVFISSSGMMGCWTRVYEYYSILALLPVSKELDRAVDVCVTEALSATHAGCPTYWPLKN